MKITKKGEYGLRAVLALAAVYEESQTLNLRQIAKLERIPHKFLEQIMILLRKADLVISTKGKAGGYSLSRPPEKITIGEAIRSIEGPLAPLDTAAEIKRRIQTDDRHPGFYCVLLDVRNAVAEILDKKTLAEVCEKSQQITGSKSPYEMYYI